MRDRQALDTAVAILVKAVDGEDPGSACFGLATLAENGTDLAVLEPAIEPVIAMFSQDHPSQRTRFHAARFLSLVAVETQDRQMLTAAVTTLLRMIGSAAANNRGAVCVILTRLAERGAESAALKPTIPLLAKRLADPEKSVRDGAEAALAAIGTPEAKAALRAHGG